MMKFSESIIFVKKGEAVPAGFKRVEDRPSYRDYEYKRHVGPFSAEDHALMGDPARSVTSHPTGGYSSQLRKGKPKFFLSLADVAIRAIAENEGRAIAVVTDRADEMAIDNLAFRLSRNSKR